MVVKLSIGGVSLILADVRFGSFSQNLVTFFEEFFGQVAQKSGS